MLESDNTDYKQTKMVKCNEICMLKVSNDVKIWLLKQAMMFYHLVSHHCQHALKVPW